MNKTKTPKTDLTLSDAISQVTAYTNLLMSNKIAFIFNSNPATGEFKITGKIACDEIKVLIPQAEIEVDIHKRPYAVITVKYKNYE